MREFKFKAWTGEDMFEDVGGIGIDVDYGPWFSEDGLNDLQFCKAIMQSTGLKDINGTEIYEGDIVQVFHPLSSMCVTRVVGLVRWESTDAMFRIITGESDYGFHSALKVEVIGNKFENKDLLK